MMQELFEKGPLVVSFEPDYNFMMYKSGIYHSIDEKTWISKGIPKPEWEKVDHSVLVVGWGEDENTKEKYWIIQNTWGPQWGEDGYFRMRRGVDEFGIESICEASDPIIIQKTTGKILQKRNLENENIINEISNNNGFNNINNNNIEQTFEVSNRINNNEKIDLIPNSNSLLNGSNTIDNESNNDGFNLNLKFYNLEKINQNNAKKNVLEEKSIFDIFA